MKYLTEKDRYLIEKLHQEKTPVAKIAEMIGCCRATVYNEIKRGTFIARGKLWQNEKRYGYDVGQRIHKENMSRRGRKRKLSADDPFLAEVAALILDQKYSPEAALYALPDHKLCVKSIYNYVYAHRIKGVTVNNLPYAKPRKKKRMRKKQPKENFLGVDPSKRDPGRSWNVKNTVIGKWIQFTVPGMILHVCWCCLKENHVMN